MTRSGSDDKQCVGAGLVPALILPGLPVGGYKTLPYTGSTFAGSGSNAPSAGVILSPDLLGRRIAVG